MKTNHFLSSYDIVKVKFPYVITEDKKDSHVLSSPLVGHNRKIGSII